MRYIYRFLLFCFVSLPSCCYADDVLDQIWKDWQTRYKDHQTVRYEMHGEVLKPRGGISKDAAHEEYFPKGASGPIPPEDYKYKTRSAILLDLKKGRARREVDQKIYYTSAMCFVPQWEWDLFDGEKYQLYRPREKNEADYFESYKYEPDLQLYGTKMLARFFAVPNFPVLFAHGIVPTHLHPALPENMGKRRDLKEFTVQGRGYIGDRECVILETRHSDNFPVQYWVDMARKSAIARVSWLQGSRETTRLDINYQKINNDWYPKDWIWSGIQSKKGESPPWERVSVDSIEFDKPVSDNQFSMDLREGMTVCDIWKDEDYIYNGLNKPRSMIHGGQLVTEGENKGSGRTFRIGFIVAGLTFIILGLFFFRKRKVTKT